MLKRRPTLKRYIRRGNPPPLIYLYSDTEYVAVSEQWISLIPAKTRQKVRERRRAGPFYLLFGGLFFQIPCG